MGGGADALEKSHKRWQSIDSASGYPLRILLLSLFFFFIFATEISRIL